MVNAWLQRRRRHVLGWAVTALLTAFVGLLLVRGDIAARREVFQAEARSAHRLLSQRMAQHEAILATLALNAPSEAAGTVELPLPAGYLQLLSAQRVPLGPRTGGPSDAPSVYRVEPVDESSGRYALVTVHRGFVYRLVIDARRLLQDDDWPWSPDGPVRVALALQGAGTLLQAGAEPALRPAGLTEGFRFTQRLASESQAFDLRAQRWTGPAEWPWGWLAVAAVASSVLVLLLFKALALRRERERAAERERLSKVARLNTLGELAAGMAHELNQPLTAILSGTQAALRLLKEAQQEPGGEGPGQALPALELAAAQARRAAEVVARLRGLVKSPALGPVAAPVDLAAQVRGLLEVLAPDLRARHIAAVLRGQASPVRADPVALEQILHNLLTNAMQALERGPDFDRSITVTLQERPGWVDCLVADNGPGLPPDQPTKIFEPFFTTRDEGLGLGLSLCQTLAQAMGGQLSGEAGSPRGALFRLSLPTNDTGTSEPRQKALSPWRS